MLYQVEVETKTYIFKTLTDLFRHLEDNNIDVGITRHMFYKTYDKTPNLIPNQGIVIFENDLIKVIKYDISRNFPRKKTKGIVSLILLLLSVFRF